MNLNKVFLIMACCFLSNTGWQPSSQPLGLIEKIYAQTDRPLYFPGETIWFKAYVVNGENQVTSLSEIAYAELISPKGNVLKSTELRIVDGYAYHQFFLNKSLPGGRYTLKIFTQWMQEQGEEFIFTKELIIQKVVKPNILLKLDLQKTAYGAGATFKADFIAKDLENKLLKNTEISFQTLIEGKTIATQKMMTDAAGKALIIGQLPSVLNSSDALLLVNIEYRNQTESISRSIPVIRDETDLQFLPEGGQALVGHSANFAFKAVNEFGKPVDVSGFIMDEKENEIALFSSSHDGMGKVSFVPELGRTYSAKITKPYQSKKTYPVNRITNEGVHLYYSSRIQSFNIRANTEEEVRIAVFKNGGKVFQKNINLNKGINNIDLPISEFSMGIHKVLIENYNQKKLAERLVFFHPERKLNIEIITNKDRYQNREEMAITLRTTDAENKPVPANLSVGITDEKINNVADDKQGNILANLLLTSELKGKIHEPNYYFDEEESERFAHLDLLMMTHGWRSYLESPILDLANAKVLPERNFYQTGVVTDKNGKGVAAEVLIVNNQAGEVIRLKTQSDGFFSFLPMNRNQYNLLAFQENNKSVRITLDSDRYYATRNRNLSRNKQNLAPIGVNNLKPPVPAVIQDEGVFNLAMGEGLQLNEVVVTGYSVAQIDKDKTTSGAISVVSSSEIRSIPQAGLGRALASRAAGIIIEEGTGRADGPDRISIRGQSTLNGNEPIVVLDGIVVSDLGGSSSALESINTNEIESISIVKGLAATAIYGSKGSNGVILINSKNKSFYSNYNLSSFPQSNYRNYAHRTFYHRGRQLNQPQQFYQPIYKEKNPEERTDFRNTIYWNPVVQTDGNGEAKFTTFTSDALTSFAITVEGVSAYGQPGYQQKKIFTQKELSVNASMPAFLSVGDTLKLPVTIVNNSDKKRKGKVTVDLPKGVELLYPKMPLKYEVAPNSFKKIVLTCLPLAPGKNQNIQIKIHAGKQTDQFKKPVTIARKDFPAELSMSGVGNKKLKFELTNPVENSIQAELKIYLDVVGQAMDGIEGILRQSYGCFEQTSSSTYPNVLVLNYLRSTGKTNKTIEKQALDFIKKGYKRLVGFETSKGGFEWFGKTPPHETLTGYGILEFTEMQEVYDGVDQQMINRTVKWLLSRRDGKGGFKKSEKGLDSFGRASKKVANAYLVYVLSKVGKIKKTELEYQTALAEALKSEDPYRMGLLLRAAQFRKDVENKNLLLQKIDNLIEKTDWSKLFIEETIVRSGDRGRKIETAAILVMGLLEEEAFAAKASEGIQFILNQRKNGRFGATQATCLAIEALLDYAKKQESKLKASDGKLLVTINGHEEVKPFSEVKNGILKIDQLEDFITAGEQEITIQTLEANEGIPFTLDVNYFTSVPKTHPNCPLKITTTVPQERLKLGDNLRLEVAVENTTDRGLPMATALVGIPGGASVQPWQLKEILDREEIAYYEIFDHYLVFYWRDFKPNEEKIISLDLKTEFAGEFESAPGCVYLYYTDEEKYWTRGERVGVF